MQPSVPFQLLASLAGNSSSNEERLRLLEFRLTQQSGSSSTPVASQSFCYGSPPSAPIPAPLFSPAASPAQTPATGPAPAVPESSASKQQPARRESLPQAVEGAAGGAEAPALKRKRHSSPGSHGATLTGPAQTASLQPAATPSWTAPRPTAKAAGSSTPGGGHEGSTGTTQLPGVPPPPAAAAAAAASGSTPPPAPPARAQQQTKLRAYYPLVDSGSSRESSGSGDPLRGSRGQQGDLDTGQTAPSAARAAGPAEGCTPNGRGGAEAGKEGGRRGSPAGAGGGRLGRSSSSSVARQARGGGGLGGLAVILEEGGGQQQQGGQQEPAGGQQPGSTPGGGPEPGQLGPEGQGPEGLQAQQQAGGAGQQQVHAQLPGGGGQAAGGGGQDLEQAVAQATAELRQLLERQQQQLAAVQESSRQSEAALQQRLAAVQAQATAALEARRAGEERESRIKAELTRSLQSEVRSQRELSRLNLAARGLTLGGVAVQRDGLSLQEVWQDGPAFLALHSRLAALASQREEVEATRKALRKRIPTPPSARTTTPAATAPPAAGAAAGGAGLLSPRGQASRAGGAGQGEDRPMEGRDFVAQDDIFKMCLARLKREEEGVREEVERLAALKARHCRELKRLRDEEGSRWGGGSQVLGGRFVLLNLLGKGGFSEVFKAYDLSGLAVVAVKVHQLSAGWSEARKASYVKHAIREVDIQKSLRHPGIVSLLDLVEVDAHCFATVLEYCEGGDLDGLLREHAVLPEKEGRTILLQVMAGLVYLNQPGRRVIHYDLKPANILFDRQGAAKITDFGLSKVVEEGCTQGLELTSQGAGTYWYLPPECFEVGGPRAPRISNKVDVWSVGVLFFQMLYGRRPFGEGLSQETIMRERVVLNACQVEFPSKPAVSADAKDFMRRCLVPRQEERWDILTAAACPYITSLARK